MQLALPRKWRPQTFDALVGQDAVSRTLTHALESGRVNHAYLFTGPRGVGKTTTARLLAASLNCEKGPTVTPCGACASCREIASRGESLDTIELDAASNNSVEDARELIEILRYAPQRDRYRILILDEVHMLSKAAFNALLKTIEEPPPHAIFILASTELHKIPATIISRCQRFSFRRLTEPEIEERLREVAQKESLTATAGALAAIARAAEGSLRDALSLLDQAATLSGGRIDEQRCAEIFAFVDRTTLEALFGAVVSGDRAALVGILSRAREEGLDPRHGSREFLSFLREVLLASANPPAKDERLGKLAGLAPYETLLRAVAVELETERDLPRAADPWIVWEMALLKMAELPRLRSIEEMLSSSPAPEKTHPAATKEPRFVSLVPAPEADAPAAPLPEDPARKFLKLLESRRVTVGAYASLATRIEQKEGELVLEFPIDKASAKDSLSRPEAAKLLSETAREVYGRDLAIRFVTGPPADGNLTEAARQVPPQVLSRERASSRAQEDPMVQKAMALFRGEVVDIKEKK
ncbi:MAG: DNA polymerase III subunit gamma/tau [Thermoanaerobaculia bacterium]